VAIEYGGGIRRMRSEFCYTFMPRENGGGGGNREPAKLAMRIADEHSSAAREPAAE